VADKTSKEVMDMREEIFTGILREEKGKTYLLGKSGARFLESSLLWEGYLKHWHNKAVCARLLPQRDYKEGNPIVIMWPYEEPSGIPFVELYYNERLVKYPASTLGHFAINVNGEIFNFSHLLNENEVIKKEEYFYRPALGEFAPHPQLGVFNVDDPKRPYYDKFGRLFMRTIHVLRIEGLDTKRLSGIYHDVLERIHSTPINPKKPEKYPDFNIFTQSCTTIIRDGLREYGFRSIGGLFPRDLFVNIAFHLLKEKREDIEVKLLRMKQLKVPEAPYSALTPFLNPMNRIRAGRLPEY
jgi:hypothetical protein